MSEQGELSFDGESQESGLSSWRAAREQAAHDMVRRLGLPLNRQVEIWLRGGIRLRGCLRLREEVLFLEEEEAARLPLVVEGVVFTAGEIESCVRVG